MDDLTTDQSATIEPITSSADGTRNSYSLFCATRGQSMNYAACLWRQGVLSKPDVKTPEDWNSCRTAACSGGCAANNMREEELIAGKSIYFRARLEARRMANNFGAAVRQWVMPAATSEKPVRTPAARPAPAKSMLDAIGSAGTFADAVTEAAKAATEAPITMTKATPAVIPIVVANTGESPLAMARRIAAERSAHGR